MTQAPQLFRHCKTCRHWQAPERNRITEPHDPDTYKPMLLPFEVRECKHPRLLFCERPLEENGFAVADGSEYFAALYTAESFGCVRHESIVGAMPQAAKPGTVA